MSALQLLGFLSRLTQDNFRYIFATYVRPHLEYCLKAVRKAPHKFHCKTAFASSYALSFCLIKVTACIRKQDVDRGPASSHQLMNRCHHTQTAKINIVPMHILVMFVLT